MSSKDLRGVHCCTGLCGDVRDRVGFYPFGKVVYKGQQVLVLTRCGQIQTRDVQGCDFESG